MDHPPRRTAWARAGWAVLLLLLGLVAAQLAGLAFAAFSYMLGAAVEEEDIDWGTQPLEIVADGSETCYLNVGEVAPGRHDVHAFAMESPAKILVKNPAGEVVFRASVQPEETVTRTRSLRIRDFGEHRVECHSGGVVTRLSSA